MATLKDINYGIGKYLTVSDASAIPDIGTNRKNLDLLNFKVATNNAYALRSESNMISFQFIFLRSTFPTNGLLHNPFQYRSSGYHRIREWAMGRQ